MIGSKPIMRPQENKGEKGEVCIRLNFTTSTAAGLWAIEVAKGLRPDTLRGLYGIDRERSATILEEQGGG